MRMYVCVQLRDAKKHYIFLLHLNFKLGVFIYYIIQMETFQGKERILFQLGFFYIFSLKYLSI